MEFFFFPLHVPKIVELMYVMLILGVQLTNLKNIKFFPLEMLLEILSGDFYVKLVNTWVIICILIFLETRYAIIVLKIKDASLDMIIL